jgi:beta-lactamase class A
MRAKYSKDTRRSAADLAVERTVELIQLTTFGHSVTLWRPARWHGRVMEVGVGERLAEIGRVGAVCVVDIDGAGEITMDADRVVPTGSAFKIAVCLEVFCQAASGNLDLAEPLRFEAERAPVSDPTVETAVGLMMRLSDNVATRALIHHVGHDRIQARLAALGLRHTTIGPADVTADVERMKAILDRLGREVGFARWEEPASIVEAGDYGSIERRLTQIRTDERSLPHTLLGPTTTARELASLWAMIWRDEAGPPAACARVRAAAGQQQLRRLELGFDVEAGTTVASKGGTIPGVISNDVGVVTFPDGRRYAAGVYTRAQTAFAGEQAVPQAIGAIAAAAIHSLRRS